MGGRDTPFGLYYFAIEALAAQINSAIQSQQILNTFWNPAIHLACRVLLLEQVKGVATQVATQKGCRTETGPESTHPVCNPQLQPSVNAQPDKSSSLQALTSHRF